MALGIDLRSLVLLMHNEWMEVFSENISWILYFSDTSISDPIYIKVPN